MAISDYSTTRDSNASIAPGDLRSNDYRRDQQIINAIRQLMADLAAFTGGTAVFAAPFQIKNAGITVFVVPADNNGGIELGRIDGNTSTPFIDFHAGATVVDRDARIICVTGTGSNDGGELQIAATPLSLSKGQLKFPATQNASSDANTLDDYEKGTWTPTITFSTPGDLSVAYGTQTGTYLKIGQLVWLKCVLSTSTFTHTTAAGEFRVDGVPFTSLNAGAETTGSVELGNVTFAAGRTYANANIPQNASYIRFIDSGSAVARDAIDSSEALSGTQKTIIATVVYRAAN